MSPKREPEAPKIRELFIEELAEVRGGDPGIPVATTQACCEEIVDSCCGILKSA